MKTFQNFLNAILLYECYINYNNFPLIIKTGLTLQSTAPNYENEHYFFTCQLQYNADNLIAVLLNALS